MKMSLQYTTLYVYEQTMNFKFTFACQNHTHQPSWDRQQTSVLGTIERERNRQQICVHSFLFVYFCDSIG